MAPGNGKRPARKKAAKKKPGANKRNVTIKGRIPAIPDTIVIDSQDLTEWKIRRKCYEQACVHKQMVEESYRSSIMALRANYGIEGPFDIEPDTGKITLRGGQ
jgi:hypothetical protein